MVLLLASSRVVLKSVLAELGVRWKGLGLGLRLEGSGLGLGWKGLRFELGLEGSGLGLGSYISKSFLKSTF